MRQTVLATVILSCLLNLMGCVAVHRAQAQLSAQSKPMSVRTIDGYRGIWFDLGQQSEFGSKYSGGLATYTAKHVPMAVYSAAVERTFFVYGGTTDRDERHLLAMIGAYDHVRHVVSRPTVVHDKQGVNDPHDNPSLNLDESGHLWVFVSGRGRRRPGYIYRSVNPYEINGFDRMHETEFTYPQPWWIEGLGFVHLFTQYTAGRELYWATSDTDGQSWSPPAKLASMGGHYQVSNLHDGTILTAFNMHPGGNVDRRTNLYFVKTTDRGVTWTTADGTRLETPLTDPNSPALVRNYRAEGRLVYMKDINFDDKGRPAILYVTSEHHQPGPNAKSRQWTIAHWTGDQWRFHEVAEATHNYDMGSLYTEPDGTWRLIAPTEPGPQLHGTGGEMAMWISIDEGFSWKKTADLTCGSVRNHGYARRPVNAHPDFYAFWADGDPDELSRSHLYFTNQSGSRTWQLPYEMHTDDMTPMELSRDANIKTINVSERKRSENVCPSQPSP